LGSVVRGQKSSLPSSSTNTTCDVSESAATSSPPWDRRSLMASSACFPRLGVTLSPSGPPSRPRGAASIFTATSGARHNREFSVAATAKALRPRLCSAAAKIASRTWSLW
jgi:hypothetical protein